MKKVILITLGVTLSIVTFGQQSQKQKEAGAGFSNLNNWGVFYRVGNPKSLWRFTMLHGFPNLTQYYSPDVQTKFSGYHVSVRAGKEFRKSMTDHLDFRFGGDLMFNYHYLTRTVDDLTMTDNDSYSKSNSIGPGINLVAGLNYRIKRILIGAEYLPCFQYWKGKAITQENGVETKIDFSGSGYCFTSGLLSLAYQF